MHKYFWYCIVLASHSYAQSTSKLANALSISTSEITAGTLSIGSGVSYTSYSFTATTSESQLSLDLPNSLAPLVTLTPESSPTTSTTAILVAKGTSTPSVPSVRSNIPCNGYSELCYRQYSNITYIGAHNSPFDIPSNLASNQDYGVIEQLNDGIRMLQGQTHVVNDTIYFCHTSCALLNAGTAEAYFTNVTTWLAAHPNDVVTILIVNSDNVSVKNFTVPLVSSGLSVYAYIPPLIPMSLTDWPTLGELILKNQRAIIFMDSGANQTTVPYILDEFSQMWETPFDPTNQTFSCTVQRPPGISNAQAMERMYLANHNLNTPLNLLGDTILVPDTALLNETNAASGYGSLGLAAANCAATWGRPPNFLLVDYYNGGNGSVFDVAAQLNSVTQTTNSSCCGTSQKSFGRRRTTQAGQILIPTSIIAGLLVL
ncbi:hypothetical protein MMC34_006738 [Xylographa carneopallida]|nr:hypothetical protein [Xylographa carneopallida]